MNFYAKLVEIVPIDLYNDLIWLLHCFLVAFEQASDLCYHSFRYVYNNRE